MNKKVLIYFNDYQLKPIGGPAGYLYNLKKGLEKLNVSNIYFIEGKDKKKIYKKLLNILPGTVRKLYYFFERIKERKFLLSKKLKRTLVSINEYDIIHFHSTIALYKCKDSLKNYKGKIILTSHSPKPMFLEKYEDSGLFNIEKKINRNKYIEGYSKIDEFAFNRADYITFPCEDAEEPYYNNWSEYEKIKSINKEKYKYILTGIDSARARIIKEDFRKKYNIPKDAFVISYVGRHNEVKGYLDLKEIGEELLKDENTYFLIAGREEPLKGIKNPRWIEIGWTSDPHSLIAASDVFILPNKETYFDLIMLEVLSLGKIVIASYTGGNKLFEKINAEGIFLYKNLEELKKYINLVKYMNENDKNLLEKNNRLVYENNFTKEKFAQNYINLLEEL